MCEPGSSDPAAMELAIESGLPKWFGTKCALRVMVLVVLWILMLKKTTTACNIKLCSLQYASHKIRK